MKLQIMRSDAIAYIKKNIDILLSHYDNGDDPKLWLSEAIGAPAFQVVDALEFEDFELLINEEKPSSTDVLNIKQFYTKTKQLNDSFASDERLWAGLSHTVFYEYMLKRWPGKNDATSIINHYFFQGGTRSYMVNTLARLWWLGRKLYREEGEDHFVHLDYISHDINGYSFTLFGSNWTNSEHMLKLFFDAVFKYTEQKNERVGRGLFNDAMQYANFLSGIYVLDACEDEFIVNKLLEFLVVRSQEIAYESEYNRLNNVRTTGVEKFDNVLKAINQIGGHGKLNEIITAYEGITQTKASVATKEYISSSLEKNCPEKRAYSGKPIFYFIHINEGNVWKVANEYLIKDNMRTRKMLMDEQISNLDSKERLVFNLITAINGTKFELNDLYMFSQQLTEFFPTVDDAKDAIRAGVKALSDKGLLEKIENDTYKKSYAIKINQ